MILLVHWVHQLFDSYSSCFNQLNVEAPNWLAFESMLMALPQSTVSWQNTLWRVAPWTLHLYAVQALVGAASSNCSDKGQCRAGNALMAVLIPTTSGWVSVLWWNVVAWMGSHKASLGITESHQIYQRHHTMWSCLWHKWAWWGKDSCNSFLHPRPDTTAISRDRLLNEYI